MTPTSLGPGRRPVLATTLLALAALSPSIAAQELFGSHPPEAGPPVGSHTVFLHENTVPQGTMEVHESDPGLFVIEESPFGSGTMKATESGWIAYYDSGPVADYTWNAATGRFDFSVQGMPVVGYLVPGPTTIVPYGPQDPQGQGPKITVGVNPGHGGRGPEIDIGAIWPPWLDPWIENADFYQFSRITITVLRANPAGGPPLEEPIPPGTTISGSGNGGVSATPGQISQGAGTEAAGGSRVYVDSGTGGTPGYRASGGVGTAPPGGCSMRDAPKGDLLPQLGGVLAGMNDPLSIIGIRTDIEFTTYLVVDGMVIWVQTWSWSRTEYLDPTIPNPAPQGSIQLGPAGSVSGLEATHETALQDYLDGGFNGAPVH